MAERGVAAGLLLFALAWAGAQSVELRRELASRRWPRTRGRVVAAAMDAARTSHMRGLRVLGDVEPHVNVEYTVAGRAYRTAQVRWAGVPILAASRTLARYPEGAEVSVAYDPADPGIGLLEPGPTLVAVVQLTLALGLALGALVWLASPAAGARA